MKTDSLFYRLFQNHPSLVFELLGDAPPSSGSYTFGSQEVKQLSFRIDGILNPSSDAPDLPIVFVEVQGYPDRQQTLYHTFFAEIFLYLRDYQPTNDWMGLIIFTKRSLDPRLPHHFQDYVNSPRFRRVYLDELPVGVVGRSLELSVLQLIGMSERDAPDQARLLVERTRLDITDVAEQGRIVELIVTTLVYKFPTLNREEIRQMLGLVLYFHNFGTQFLLTSAPDSHLTSGSLLILVILRHDQEVPPSFHLEVVEFLQHLLPNQAQLQLKQWTVNDTDQRLILTVSSVQPVAGCPLCEQLTHRVHSRYERTLQDLPCANYKVTLLLQVRKFFCVNDACQRRIFTERLPQVTDPWARRTVRLAQHLVAIGLALGGAAGVRLSQRLSHPVSLNPLLQLISRLPFPAMTVPTTLGVDDFAFRKGHRYGTILVDLDRHQPIALLKDREANTVATWLQQHPGVQILSRDRSKAYKQGMTQGEPDAIQVADRFHLLQNLTQVLERFLATQSSALKAVDLAYHQALGQTRVDPPPPPTAQQQKAEQRRQRRLANYEQVHQLRQQGFAVKDIAHHLGMGERTVFTYLASPAFPEWQPTSRRRSKPTLLTPYKSYLLAQWNAGKRQTKQLFEEIVQQGYPGTYKTVAKYTHQLREAQRQELNTLEGRGPVPASVEVGQPPLSSNRAAWLILKSPKQRTDLDETLLAQLQQQPELAPAIDLAQQFAEVVRQRQSQQLDRWLEQANNSSIKQFQNFAKSLQEDYEAVKSGVTLEVSNGQVEGQINRLKMLKRQMYGRAGLELLSRRFLLAS